MRLDAGRIVLVDWRDALPKEPNKRRPAIVVEDTDLFDEAYPNVILVPLTGDARLGIPELCVPIPPSPENGCPTLCHALAHHVTTTSKKRLEPTASRITESQLAAIRARIALAIGFD